MPVRVIGMIGVTPPTSDAALHVIEGGLSTSYLTHYARAHDEAGFDLALVGHTSSSAEGFLVALHAAAHTEKLGYLIAHRPGFVAPTLMARKHARRGRGASTPKAGPPPPPAGFLKLMNLGWWSHKPFDFAGEFYRVNGAD